MLAVYKRILVAVDFSNSCVKATQKAKELSEKYGATLDIFHAVEYLPQVDSSFGGVSPFDVDLTEQLIETAKKHLADLSKRFSIPKERQWVELGSPKSEILRVADDIKADLIIVGSHGRHGIALLMGSTASSVVHHAICDVLAVRLPKE